MEGGDHAVAGYPPRGSSHGGGYTPWGYPSPILPEDGIGGEHGAYPGVYGAYRHGKGSGYYKHGKGKHK